MKCFVNYNGQYMTEYQSVKACINFINRKGWKNDEDNLLYIVDEEGNEYDTVTGEQIIADVVTEELSAKEFDNLVDMINDNPDMTINPDETKDGIIVLHFPKINGYFRCLERDYDKAVDYINDPSMELNFKN